MWPFSKKRKLAVVSIPRLDIPRKDDELDRLRLEALDALKRSDEAAQAALEAIDKGAPADCPEVAATRDAINEANKAIRAWIKAGGL